MSPTTAWRTVQHAANMMVSGETVTVAQGTYNEHVSVATGGITIQADPQASSTPVVQGFDIGANNVTVNGFEITSQNNAVPAGYGVHLHNASNVTVENNYIHDLCHDGVYFESSVSDAQVLNNTIVHAQMSGINIDGSGSVVQGNDISATYQHPSVLGGMFSVCTNDGGSNADADAIRFFGANHIIRSNYLHDIEYDFGNTAKPNPNPHTDCFQTWGEPGEPTGNILIDRNWCVWPGNGSQGTMGEVSSIEALNGSSVGNLTYQNNIFQDMIRGVNATQDNGAPLGQLNFYNNTFDHVIQEAIVVGGSGARSDNIENNIFYDEAGGDGFIAYSGGEYFLDNVFYNRRGAPGGVWWGGGATPPFMAMDPMFVSYGSSIGVGANYALCVAGQNGCTGTSPVGHVGVTITSVPNDYVGNQRSNGYSIGSMQMMH
jgi:parallel beta-helix repeat protein